MDEKVTTKLQAVKKDITTLEVDAIVNAANKTLMGGGGVDGAIHAAAGVKLKLYCLKLFGCKTGEAKLTPGCNLPAKYIIHTVGPVWKGGDENENELLKSCYVESLKLADANDIKSIAFPCISTGVYQFPRLEAADIAVHTVEEYIQGETKIEEVIFCCYLDKDLGLYNSLLLSLDEKKLHS